MNERVEFKTDDKVDIVADYYSSVEGSSKGVVLVHMMPATRISWSEFAAKLQAAGYSALAIDLRGHGESGGGNYQDFEDRDHQASIRDIEAAAKFLQEKGSEEIALAGASIGANLALQYLADNPETRAAVLFSPGIDYRGIQIKPLASRVLNKKKILFVGADDDVSTMGGTCQEISEALGQPEKICYETGGHGTNLFVSHPDLTDKIVEFLREQNP